jgi:hypothetical protein
VCALAELERQLQLGTVAGTSVMTMTVNKKQQQAEQPCSSEAQGALSEEGKRKIPAAVNTIDGRCHAVSRWAVQFSSSSFSLSFLIINSSDNPNWLPID